MESQTCLICGKSFELITADVPVTIVKNKILFDRCLSLFQINEKSYNSAYKWKWDARLDFPSFCDICAENIEKLAEFEQSTKEMKTKSHDILLKSQIIILNSIPDEKRNLCKTDHKVFLSTTVSVIEKIDYIRCIAVKNWLPVISLARCDKEVETDGIIDLNQNCLSITKEEVQQYFDDGEGGLQCKICFSVIAESRNRRRHINEVHKKVKRFQCKYCLQTFYNKWNCRFHSCRNRSNLEVVPANVPSNTTVSNDDIKCVLCYKSVEYDIVEIPSDVFASFCCLSNSNPLISDKIIFSRLGNALLSCLPCSTMFTDIHNLKMETEQIENKLNNLLLQVKADILISMSAKNVGDRAQNDHRTERFSSTEKIKYFGKLAVGDFCPGICLFKMEAEPNYDNVEYISKDYRPKSTMQRTPTENSLFKLLADDEVIDVTDGTPTTVVPLTDAELKHFYKRDGEKFICQLCGSIWSSYWGAVSHCNKRHKKIKRFRCKYCLEEFYYKHECANHILTSHKMERADIAAQIEKTLKLPSDSVTTQDGVIKLENKSDVSIRLSTDDIIKLSNKSYKCAICSKVYLNRNTVLDHQKKVHLKSYRYKCEFCNYKNHHKHPVLYHVRSMHPDKQEIIDAKSNKPTAEIPMFLTKRLLTRKKKRSVDPSLTLGMKILEPKTIHKIEEHFTVIQSNYSCKKCGREFTCRYHILQHIERIHFGIRRYQCSVCNQKFYKVTCCKKHMNQKHPGYLESLRIEITSNRNAEQSQSFNQNTNAEGNQNIPSSSVNMDFNYGNDEEIEQEIPSKIKIELEINGGSPEVNIDVGELFVYKTEVIRDSPEIAIDIEEPFVQKAEKNELHAKLDNSNSHTTEAGIIKIERNSNESTENGEMILGLDVTEDAQSEKILLYKFIKPGEIIELPKSPNYEINRNKGCKRLGGGYKCVKCNRLFKKRSIFVQHWGIFHDTSGGYQCSVCKERFYAKFKCAQHYIHKHTDLTPFICQVCDSTFKCNASLKQHVQRHMGERHFTCLECPLKFITQERLDHHHEHVHMKIIL